MKIKNPSIGSDIELFIQHQGTGKIITAEGVIKGTKENPYKFDENNPYYATSLDCVSAEFNIPPCKTAGEYYKAIQHAMDYINNNLPNDFRTVAQACARLEDDQLQSRSARTYGCSPSMNTWNGKTIRPNSPMDNLRVSGKHIHIGYADATPEISMELGKAMDLFLGIPAVLMEPENERKTSGYGGAGNIRLHKYGSVNGRQ